MTSEKSLWRVAVLSFVLVLALQALPLAAASPDDLASSDRHCVAALERVKPGKAAARSQRLECFPTFSDAIYHATEGRVFLPDGLDLKDQLDLLGTELKAETESATVIAPATFVIAIDYEDSGFDDSTLTWTTPEPCTALSGWQVTSMPSGWNDQVGSTQGFSDCNRNILYEHINFGGAVLTCSPTCSNLGSMDDETSSRLWLN
jgi:hypothetical protein